MENDGSSERRKVAILGTGKMGSAIAIRLDSADFEVVLWDRTRSRAEALNCGAVADTPAAATRAAGIVISSLTGPEAVRAVYGGPDGALSAGRGKHFVEMSTAGPDLVSELAPQVVAAGGTLIDAPIVGPPPAVRMGAATILVGGLEADLAPIRSLLDMLGAVRHVGRLGAAARLKLVANSMLADVVTAAAELQVAGEHAGLDAQDVFWVLERIVPILDIRRAGFIEDRHTSKLFTVRDLRKDLNMALALFSGSGVSVPMTESASKLITETATETPELDITAVARLFRHQRAATVEQHEKHAG